MNLSQFFISRPVFAGVLSALILIVGLISLPNLPISEYPEVVPPTVVVRATYPGANPKVIADTVAGPLEQAINGVEDMLYQFSQATSDGVMTLTVTFKLGTDVDKAQVLVQNRVAQAHAEAAAGRAASRRDHGQGFARHHDGGVHHLAGRALRSDLSVELSPRCTSRTSWRDRRRRRRAAVRRRQLFDARVARSGKGRRARPDRGRRRQCDPRTERAGRRRSARFAVDADHDRRFEQAEFPDRGQHQGPPRRRGRLRQHHHPHRRRRARSRACATSRGSNWARTTTRCARCSTTRPRSRFRSSSAPAATRSRSPTRCARRWRS